MTVETKHTEPEHPKKNLWCAATEHCENVIFMFKKKKKNVKINTEVQHVLFNFSGLEKVNKNWPWWCHKKNPKLFAAKKFLCYVQ